ncbi:Ger(x)C family spore germination protein [Bacillus pacificus]
MPPEKILERQGILTIIGFDLLDENTYKGTISLLQFDRKEEKTSVTLSAVGTTSKQIRQNLEQQTSHDLTSGQLRTILFDKYMTEMIGISSFLDTMQRDSSIGSLIFWQLQTMLRVQLIIKTMKNTLKWGHIFINY